MLKDRCVSCRSDLENSERKFAINGNFCSQCCVRASQLAFTKALLNTSNSKLHRASLKNDTERLDYLKFKIQEAEEDLDELIKTCRQYYDGEILKGG